MRPLLLRAYALLLRLYPAAFRQAFGEEMQSVFAARLDETPGRPALPALRVLLRELFDLPAGLAAAWRWSLRRAALLAPRRALASPGMLPSEHSPTPWVEALLAGLPFLLLGLVSGLPGLLRQPEAGTPLTRWLVYPLVLAGAGCLIWSVLRGWPRWAAGWYLIWMIALLYPLSALVSPESLYYQFLLAAIFPLLIAWLLYRLARRDRLASLLAALPAMLLVWVPFMEQTPRTIIPAPLRGGTFFTLFLLAGLASVLFLRVRRLGLGLVLALCATALGGAMAAYSGIYHGGLLPFSEPGPSPRAAVEVFLPAFLFSASISTGPQLARSLRDLGVRAGRGGGWAYRLALFGLLLMLVFTVTVYYRESNGGYGAWPALDTLVGRIAYLLLRSPGSTGLRWAAALLIYAAGCSGLAVLAERAGVLPRAGVTLLLFLLPPFVPAALLNGLPAYMGWDYPLKWPINLLLLAWLAASVWLVSREANTRPDSV